MKTLEPLIGWDWIVIGAFFATTLGIGIYFSRRAVTSLSDYFVAGRKMTWWMAGTSIVATSFAADTPLVISGWMRTLGLERNWFWWGGIMGMMLCTFFYARLWRRASILTDVEFNELRYSGRPAAGLRIFHATFRSLVQNTIVMGWVTLAMTKIIDVTMDIPTVVFVKYQWLPELVAKGIEVSSQIDASQIMQVPVFGEAVIPVKGAAIILCLLIAAGYTMISGLWGVIATDFFQFTFAMTGTVILMIVVMVVAGGPKQMVLEANQAVKEGRVQNRAPTNREVLIAAKLQTALGQTIADRAVPPRVSKEVTELLVDHGLLQHVADQDQNLRWLAHEQSSDQLLETLKALQVRGLSNEEALIVAKEWQAASTAVIQQLVDHTLIREDSLNEGQLRWIAHGLTETQIRAALGAIEIHDDNIEAFVGLWKHAYCVSKGAFTDSKTVDLILGNGILVYDQSPNNKKLEYYRFPDVSIDPALLLENLQLAQVQDKSEIMAAWRYDRVIPAQKITSFLPPFDLKGGGFVAIWALIVFLGLQWWAGGEGGGFLSQRLFSCKDEKHSVLAMLWFNLANYVLRPWPWIVVGVASLFMIPDVTAYGSHYDAEHAYVIMLMKYLPVGLKGMMVAALMAAYMSTISTHVNFGASYVVNDLYKRFIHPTGSERTYVIVSQAVSFLLAVLAGVYAFFSTSIATGWLVFFEMMSGAGFALLLRWYWWRINAWSEISAMTSSLVMFWLLNYTTAFHSIFSLLGFPEYLLARWVRQKIPCVVLVR